MLMRVMTVSSVVLCVLIITHDVTASERTRRGGSLVDLVVNKRDFAWAKIERTTTLMVPAEDRCEYVWCWSVAGPNCEKVEEVDLSYLECGDIKCTWCVARGAVCEMREVCGHHNDGYDGCRQVNICE